MLLLRLILGFDGVAITLSRHVVLILRAAASRLAVTVADLLDHVGMLADPEAVFVRHVWVNSVLVGVGRRPGEVVATDLQIIR